MSRFDAQDPRTEATQEPLAEDDDEAVFPEPNGVGVDAATSWLGIERRRIVVYVGFVVASGDTNTKNTSVFSNVSVTP